MSKVDKYEPEFGQFLYGQPYKQYEVPNIWLAALDLIDKELCRVMRNINQEEYDSPFGNTGNRFECDKFIAEAYSWDNDYEQPFNFKWRDVEISWYKYCGRGMSANQELTAELAEDMLEGCLEVIERLDSDDDYNDEGGDNG
jgi:hypothetical protein